MVSQNDLNETISHVACYFTSISYERETYEDYKWNADELNKIFFACKLAKYIDSSNCIYSPSMVAKMLGCNMSFVEKFYCDYKPNKDDYIIGCWKKTKDAIDAHFVVMDNSGIYTREHVIFDPWKGGSQTVDIGLCTSLRVFKKGVKNV